MRHRPAHHPVTRAAALLAALGMLVLATVVASPSLHAWLHAAHTSVGAVGHDHHHHDHDHGPGEPVGSSGHVCAITLFAGGFLPLLVAGLAVSGLRWSGEFVLRVAAHVAVPFPSYRLAPSRAPPVA